MAAPIINVLANQAAAWTAPNGQPLYNPPATLRYRVSAGVMRNLRIFVVNNTYDQPVVVGFNKNGVAQPLAVLVPLAGVGFFSDLVNSFPVVDGDLIEVAVAQNVATTPGSRLILAGTVEKTPT